MEHHSQIERHQGWKTSKSTDMIFRGITAACAALVLIVMAGIFASLLWNSLPSIRHSGISFLFSKAWDPVSNEFGALSSIYGTLMSTAIAMLLAVPLSMVIALFLVELAPPKVSYVVGSAIELLAAVPSIIYGMWGLFVFAPFMADNVQPLLSKYLGWLPLFQGPEMGIGMMTAGIILALMILPFVSTVMRDVFAMVPDVMKEAGYGMGATTWEVTKDVTIRYGIQGMIGACLLGLGRAIGETMAVTFVIGNSSDIFISLFEAGNSIASRLANEFAEASDPMYMSALMELGLVLFLMTFGLQVVTQLWLKRVKRKMGGDLL
ncbi:MAG: phosphate ABC transporter permease subunit PstC [Candidatus Electronema sp. VV]